MKMKLRVHRETIQSIAFLKILFNDTINVSYEVINKFYCLVLIKLFIVDTMYT